MQIFFIPWGVLLQPHVQPNPVTHLLSGELTGSLGFIDSIVSRWGSPSSLNLCHVWSLHHMYKLTDQVSWSPGRCSGCPKMDQYWGHLFPLTLVEYKQQAYKYIQMPMFTYWRAWMLTSSWSRQGACLEYIFQTCFSLKRNIIHAQSFLWLHFHFCDENRSIESEGLQQAFDLVRWSSSQPKCYCRHSCDLSQVPKKM